MSRCRFLYNNLITSESMISVSSLKTGLVSNAVKDGTGSAVITTGGTYTGTTDLEYVIEIDGAGTGEIGSATFKWSDDGGNTWDATGVTTDHTAITLNNGVTVCWPDHGAGADFVLADKWYFKAINLFSAGRMLDFDRDRRYRSAALGSPNTITINAGAAISPTALIIYGHNLTSGATIVLKGNTSSSWGSPPYTQTITWADDRILHYLTGSPSYQYWQLQITDASNPDTYIEIEELYLGTYLELAKNFSDGFGRDLKAILDSKTTPYGVRRSRYYNLDRTYEYNFNLLTSANVVSLEAMMEALGSKSTGIQKPVYFNADYSTPSDIRMVYLDDLHIKQHSKSSLYYDVSLVYREVLSSV